jgi:hypothetical protein
MPRGLLQRVKEKALSENRSTANWIKSVLIERLGAENGDMERPRTLLAQEPEAGRNQDT